MRRFERKGAANAARAKPSTGWRTRLAAPGALLAIAVDASLVGAAVAAAVGSVTFAGFMIAQSDRKPNVNGMEYLAIFAQPRKTGVSSGEAAPSPPTAAHDDIDMSPVGSIAAPTTAAGFALVSAQPGVAWLQEGARIVAVRPGDQAPGLGRIAAIVQRDGRWFLIGDAGTALLSSEPPAAKESSNPRTPFSRPMIFGDEP